MTGQRQIVVLGMVVAVISLVSPAIADAQTRAKRPAQPRGQVRRVAPLAPTTAKFQAPKVHAPKASGAAARGFVRARTVLPRNAGKAVVTGGGTASRPTTRGYTAYSPPAYSPPVYSPTTFVPPRYLPTTPGTNANPIPSALPQDDDVDTSDPQVDGANLDD